ncbi:AAA family ATPase [Virgibacillus sp. 179-BFC.A HS]|uniref:AAA family ATPase n=1 Tax=Tigheibacillus jepli TaxID=3035914 RepID=A0ABU5CHU6_9BACI|nr:AAA family ATPase [Virgibacillus sp. 179-BFC.A HS]MDY0405871.1 AAA family ATPase [Virgibacillus sp. 179-BFC.A HS]
MNDQAYKLRRQMEMMQCNQAKTIAFVSGKGGVGKSNAALNFSLALLKSGYRVLLIDLDVGMGNIEVLLGKQSRQTIADMFQTGSKMVDLIEEGPLNLKFIAGGTGLTAIFHADATMLESFFVQFAQVSSNFDFIVLDMGAGVSRESMQFILAADECFVITTPEPTAIMDAYSMVKHIVKSQADMSIYMVMNQVESPYSGKKPVSISKK